MIVVKTSGHHFSKIFHWRAAFKSKPFHILKLAAL